MSITNELREFIDSLAFHKDTRDMMRRIADRIDAEHGKAIERAYGEGVMSVPIALDESQWVKLPVDADGVPIHVGDELTNGEDLPARVWALMLAGDGWWCKSGESFILVAPSDLRHVKPDSWESIIEDTANFALDTQHTAGRISLEPFVERCRRLAGERG